MRPQAQTQANAAVLKFQYRNRVSPHAADDPIIPAVPRPWCFNTAIGYHPMRPEKHIFKKLFGNKFQYRNRVSPHAARS